MAKQLPTSTQAAPAAAPTQTQEQALTTALLDARATITAQEARIAELERMVDAANHISHVDHHHLPMFPFKRLDQEKSCTLVGHHCSFRFGENKMNPVRRTTLYSLQQGFNKHHFQLADGRHVDTISDVFFFLLDEAATRFEKSNG